jgi:hypothetical protein
VFIMCGILTITLDSLFSTDDMWLYSTWAYSKRVRWFCHLRNSWYIILHDKVFSSFVIFWLLNYGNVFLFFLHCISKNGAMQSFPE